MDNQAINVELIQAEMMAKDSTIQELIKANVALKTNIFYIQQEAQKQQQELIKKIADLENKLQPKQMEMSLNNADSV